MAWISSLVLLDLFLELLVSQHFRELDFHGWNRACTADSHGLLFCETFIYFFDECILEADVAVCLVGCTVAWIKAVSLFTLFLGWASLIVLIELAHSLVPISSSNILGIIHWICSVQKVCFLSNSWLCSWTSCSLAGLEFFELSDLWSDFLLELFFVVLIGFSHLLLGVVWIV